MKKASILVSREAYFFLNEESRKQRGCKPLNEKQKDSIWKMVCKAEEMAQIDKDSFGGGDGTYDGKWWSWSVDVLKAMLDKANLQYEEGPDIEYLNVRI